MITEIFSMISSYQHNFLRLVSMFEQMAFLETHQESPRAVIYHLHFFTCTHLLDSVNITNLSILTFSVQSIYFQISRNFLFCHGYIVLQLVGVTSIDVTTAFFPCFQLSLHVLVYCFRCHQLHNKRELLNSVSCPSVYQILYRE